jgi:hypothetical protein
MIAPTRASATNAPVIINFVFVVHFLLIHTSTSPNGEQQNSARTTIATFSYQLTFAVGLVDEGGGGGTAGSFSLVPPSD